MSEFLTLQQAADLAGVKVAQIRVRIAMGELTPKALGTSVTTRETTYLFSEADVVRLKTLDSVNLIWPTSITYLATPWVNQLPHPGRSEALRRP
jgi:hypothetical protein